MQEQTVTLLPLLTQGLKNELNFELNARHIVVHTLFDFINTVANATTYRLTRAMQQSLTAFEDSVFFRNETAAFMYFVVVGDLRYEQLLAGHVLFCHVGPGDWLCEGALWTSWLHAGDLRAVTDVEATSIHSSKFGEVIRENPDVHQVVVEYARAFVDQLNCMDDSCTSDVFTHLMDYDHLRQVLESSVDGEEVISWSAWQESVLPQRLASCSTPKLSLFSTLGRKPSQARG